MAVENKIKEAEFFLGKISEYEINEVDYYLSAFLSACRSIPDHLLYDYNIKFNFQIPSDDEEFQNKFRKKSKDNELTDSFMKWWDSKISEINNDELGRAMWKKRNNNIHTTSQKYNTIEYHEEGYGNPELPSGQVNLCFDVGIKHVEITGACSKFFEMMKKIVKDTYKKYP